MKNNLSEQLWVSPADKPTTYKLIGAGALDLLTGKPAFKSGFFLPGTTTIYDRYDEAGNYNKSLRYITGQYTDADGKLHYEIGYVEFDHTNSITVRPENHALYEFLERHNGNASNPFRDPSSQALFERIDYEALAKVNLDREDTEYEALTLARTMDIDALMDFARHLNVNVNQTASEVRYDMRRKAKENPSRFLAEANSPLTKIRSRLSRAQDEKVILYTASDRSWKFAGAETSFHTVTPGINQVDSLTDFVLKTRNGELVIAAINEKLGIVESIPAVTAPIAPAPSVTQAVAPVLPPARKPAAAKKAAPKKKKAAPAAVTTTESSAEGKEAQA